MADVASTNPVHMMQVDKHYEVCQMLYHGILSELLHPVLARAASHQSCAHEAGRSARSWSDAAM